MNRQIKFRVWPPNKEMLLLINEDYSLVFTNENIWVERILTDDEPDFVGYCDNNHVQQSTGKKDKASREIYEGDIVKLKTHEDFGDRFGQYIFLEVYYHDESASFRLSRDKGTGLYRTFSNLRSEDIEVVGNIFQNPELLKRDPVDLHVYSVYLDSDGSVYCYDKDGRDTKYPKSWPEKIDNVREFARSEGIKFIEG